jgi:hypothetical protein
MGQEYSWAVIAECWSWIKRTREKKFSYVATVSTRPRFSIHFIHSNPPENSGHRRSELSPRNVSPAGNACYHELFLLTIRLMLDAYWYDGARFNRDARREEYRRTR